MILCVYMKGEEMVIKSSPQVMMNLSLPTEAIKHSILPQSHIWLNPYKNRPLTVKPLLRKTSLL